MAYIFRCLSLILGYKGNRYKGYKQVLAFLEFRRLINKKIKAENKEKGIE